MRGNRLAHPIDTLAFGRSGRALGDPLAVAGAFEIIDNDGVLQVRRSVGGGVGHHDMIEIDVAPIAGGFVNDLNRGLLAFDLAHIPGRPFQFLGILPGCRLNDLVVDEKIDAGLARIVASADEEVNVILGNPELGRRQRPGQSIAGRRSRCSLGPYRESPRLSC